MNEKATSIEQYLQGINPEARKELERLRALVTESVPDVAESISYGMPTLTYRGRALVYFTASKKHLSFYPSSWAIEECQDRLGDYQCTKHAIRFTLNKPLPDALVRDLVLIHRRHIDADLD